MDLPEACVRTPHSVPCLRPMHSLLLATNPYPSPEQILGLYEGNGRRRGGERGERKGRGGGRKRGGEEIKGRERERDVERESKGLEEEKEGREGGRGRRYCQYD